MIDGGASPPGWYPDPYYPGSNRFWDGVTWTEHAQHTGYAQVGTATPVLDLAAGRSSARRAGQAFLAQGVAAAVIRAAVPLITASFARTFRELNATGRSDGPGSGFTLFVLALQPLSLVALVALVVIVVWCHRATTNARALGRPTTHSPGWAVGGWFVPIINLWYPFQIVRDLLPDGHPMRARVGRWWGLYLGGQLTLFVSAGVTLATSAPVGAVVALVPAAMDLGAGAIGRRIALAVPEAQEALAGPPQGGVSLG